MLYTKIMYAWLDLLETLQIVGIGESKLPFDF